MAGMLAMAFIFCFASPAFAAVNGGTVSQYGKAYFKGATGADLTLDSITLNNGSGMIAYALEPTLVSTRADAVYDTYSEENAQFLKGVNVIMQFGYPMNIPNLDEVEGVKADKARYATAVALQAWAVHCGAAASDSMIDYVNSPSSLTAADTADTATLEYCKDLMARAVAQTEMEHSIVTHAQTIKMEKDGNNYKAKVRVEITNCGGGYSVDIAELPTGSNVIGFTGRASETLEIVIPEDNAKDSYTLKIYGRDMRTNAHHALYTCQGQSDVSKLVAMTEDINQATPEVVCEASFVLSKTQGSASASDGDSGTSSAPEVVGDIPVSKGATYVILDGNLVLYEKDAQTLTPIANATFEVKNAAGQVVMDTTKAVTGSNGAFSIEHLPGGKYSYTQKTTAPGYAIDPNTYNFNVIATPSATKFTGRVVTVNDIVRVKVSVINGSGTGLAGAEVKAYLPDADTASGVATTDDKGVAEITGLQPGTYTLKVTKLKSGSVSDAETKTVEITSAHVNNETPITLSTKGSTTQTGIAEVIAVCKIVFPASVAGIGAGGAARLMFKRKEEQ